MHFIHRVVVTPGNAKYTDFNVLPSTQLEFSPGNTERKIKIQTKNDLINKGDQVLFVTFVSSNTGVQVDKNKGVAVVIINGNRDGKCVHSSYRDMVWKLGKLESLYIEL